VTDVDIEARLDEIDRRLVRLERLAFLGYQEIRSVAGYAYENVRMEVSADEVKRLPGMQQLQDQDALAVGLLPHELFALKATARVLRKQTRLDVVTIVRDLVRRSRAAKIKKAA
jgi:hypothetical protein